MRGSRSRNEEVGSKEGGEKIKRKTGPLKGVGVGGGGALKAGAEGRAHQLDTGEKSEKKRR